MEAGNYTFIARKFHQLQFRLIQPLLCLLHLLLDGRSSILRMDGVLEMPLQVSIAKVRNTRADSSEFAE